MASLEVVNAIQQTLENDGILQSIRAQIRSCVFKVITNDGDIHFENDAEKFNNSKNGSTSLDIVYDLLKCLNLKETLYMFEAETGKRYVTERYTLAKSLNLQIANSENTPLLSLLLSSEKTPTISRSSNNSPSTTVRTWEVNEELDKLAKKKTDEILSNHSSPVNKKILSPFPSGTLNSPGSSNSGSNSPNDISSSSINSAKSLSPLPSISIKSSPISNMEPVRSISSPNNSPIPNLESKSFVDMPYGETGDNYSDGDDNNDQNSTTYLSEEFNQTLKSEHIDKSEEELERELGVSDSFVETSIDEVPEDLSNGEESFASKSFEEKKNSPVKTIIPASTRQIKIEGLLQDSIDSPKNNRTANIKRLGQGGVTRSKAGWGNDIRDEDNDDFMFGEEEKNLDDSTSPGHQSRVKNNAINQSHSFSDGDDIDVLENLDEMENVETDELQISHRSNQDDEELEDDDISEKSSKSNNSYSDNDNNSDDDVHDDNDKKNEIIFSIPQKSGISSGEGKSGTFLSSPDHNKESEKSKFDEDGDDYGDDNDFEEELEESIADEIDSVVYSEDGNSDALSDKSEQSENSNPYGFDDDKPSKTLKSSSSLSRTSSGFLQKQYDIEYDDSEEEKKKLFEIENKIKEMEKSDTTGRLSQLNKEPLFNSTKNTIKDDLGSSSDSNSYNSEDEIIEDMEDSVASNESDAMEFSIGGNNSDDNESGENSFAFDNSLSSKNKPNNRNIKNNKLSTLSQSGDLDFSMTEQELSSSGMTGNDYDYTTSALPPVQNKSKGGW